MGDEPQRLPLSAQRELVVIANYEAELRATEEHVFSRSGMDVSPLIEFLSAADVALRPLFGVSEERLKLKANAVAAATGVKLPDLSVYYRVEAQEDELESLAAEFRKSQLISAAFVKPAAELPLVFSDMVPAPGIAPPITPLHTSKQGYLKRAEEGGIDAEFAATMDGGGGKDVRIIDIEYAWRFSHEDLLENSGGVVAGTELSSSRMARSHGTAVLGILGGDRNIFGVTGICPDAELSAISAAGNVPDGWGTAAAIRFAADKLRPGDIILIELHRAGPVAHFNEGSPLGHIPIEWWPDDLAAIKYAVKRGVIVVEVGGNGGQNLDDPIYNVNPQTPQGLMFPEAWVNPFNRLQNDSGAIVVGAGAPPSTSITSIERSRLGFSNFGAMMDAHGWGNSVVTCGFGDLSQGNNEDVWYTGNFNGTSSAAPMIAGALACIQGILKAAGKPPLDPAGARKLLQETGLQQQDGDPSLPRTQRIGNRPDLRKMIEAVLQ